MSLPRSLVRDLHAGPGLLELVIGGCAFAYAAGLITGGRLGDLFGYRRVLVPERTSSARSPSSNQQLAAQRNRADVVAT